jgi:hypothetical protein
MKTIAFICARREPATPVVRAVTDAALVCDGRVVRFDESLGSSRVGDDLIRFFQSVDIVVAHVRQHNPNLLYEIGIAHGLGIPVVFVTPASIALPVDLRVGPTISYDESPDVAELTLALKEWFRKLGRESAIDRNSDALKPSSCVSKRFADHTPETLERQVAQALSAVPGWEIQASIEKERGGVIDFIIWNPEGDSTLAALGSPVAVEVESRPPPMEAIWSLAETTKKRGLKGALLIVGSGLSKKFRRSIGSIGKRTGTIILALDGYDIESIDSPGDITRALRRSLIDMRLG